MVIDFFCFFFLSYSCLRKMIEKSFPDTKKLRHIKKSDQNLLPHHKIYYNNENRFFVFFSVVWFYTILLLLFFFSTHNNKYDTKGVILVLWGSLWVGVL